ncbi:MAG TPA: hypothetical protein VFJ20_14845 [Gemmatimonadaceae bacterium]|nr:hypothetical protein [Gemmatimonadaceae bacterium]
MIHFVVTEKGSFSIRSYLTGEGSTLADRMQIVLYDELARSRRLPLGTWVFTELDQLDAPGRELATLVAERLGVEHIGVRVMNDSRQVRLRTDLLRAAHSAGVNEHRAWPAIHVLFASHAGTRPPPAPADSPTISAVSLRYPVFVRFANQHVGNLTPLLDSPRALAEGLASLATRGFPRRDLLVVEFADTKDEHGVYRKFSAYKVGERILPKALEQSRDWMVKWEYRIFDRVRADEELAYCETNPHEAWIREMFSLARIDYGRIDYGILAGRPRLWEINTNPTIGRGPNRNKPRKPEVVEYKAMIAPARASFYENFQQAWAAIDTPTTESAGVDIAVPSALLRAIERGARQRRNAERVGSLLHVVARQPWVRPMTHVVKRALAPLMAGRL